MTKNNKTIENLSEEERQELLETAFNFLTDFCVYNKIGYIDTEVFEIDGDKVRGVFYLQKVEEDPENNDDKEVLEL